MQNLIEKAAGALVAFTEAEKARANLYQQAARALEPWGDLRQSIGALAKAEALETARNIAARKQPATAQNEPQIAPPAPVKADAPTAPKAPAAASKKAAAKPVETAPAEKPAALEHAAPAQQTEHTPAESVQTSQQPAAAGSDAAENAKAELAQRVEALKGRITKFCMAGKANRDKVNAICVPAGWPEGKRTPESVKALEDLLAREGF